MYCVSNYPSRIDDFNFNNIKILRDKFNCKIGFSDHSTDNGVVFSAIAAGAEVIENMLVSRNKKKD